MIDPIRAASIRALYAQMRNTSSAVLFILVYMIGATASFNRWPVIAAWTGAILVAQVLREALRYRFVRAAPADEQLEGWARAFVAHQGFAALLWGSSMIVFAHPDQPVTVALTLCCLFSVAAGAVPAQAYTPTSFYTLVAVLFAIVLARLAATGRFEYILLGAASALFGVAMAGYCRIQSGLVREGFRIRFENAELVAALTVQKGEAESARQRAESASVAKSKFLAAASHDLRQPLYALSLFSASLEELKLDEEGQGVVARIQDSVSVMESLFDGLLDISRLEAGVVQPRAAPIAVDELFDRISQVFWPIAFNAGLELRLRSDGEWIEGDPALVEQIVSNLVSNALRASERGGVLIAARRRGAMVRLEVWDTGKGIAAGDLERIFDEFVQVGNPERDRRKGLGLGLAIVKHAAALIGTRIEVASRIGHGSRFAFSVPVTQARADAKPPAASWPASTAQRVLLIDDDLSVRAAIGDLLRRWNQPADIAATASAALDHVRAGRRYDLVLSDYRLGGDTNGLELIVALRALHPDPAPRCCLVTGDLEPSLIAAAEAESVPVLHKPLSADQLKRLLGRG